MPAKMTYRLLQNVGVYEHCMWMDNTNKLWEEAGIVRNTYRSDLLLGDHVVDWLKETAQYGWKLSGYQRSGMAVMFASKADAALFKLRWDQP